MEHFALNITVTLISCLEKVKKNISTEPKMTSDALDQALGLLSHSVSAKRRSGAKALRKLGDLRAGPVLLQALIAEVKDPRSWETQYQLVMALGACAYVPAIPVLQELSRQHFSACMLYVGIGDALMRLALADQITTKKPGDQGEAWQALDALLNQDNSGLTFGACQALAMMHLVPPSAVIDRLIELAQRVPLHERQSLNLRAWVTAAAPGWLGKSQAVQPFLEECVASENTQVKVAAEFALKGKYRKWTPL